MAENTGTVKKVLKFAGDHWGEAYAAFDIVSAFLGNEPKEDAHRFAKLAHGGLWSWDDEIALYGLELDLKGDGDTGKNELAKAHSDFRKCVRANYGERRFGRASATWYLHRLRQAIIKMRSPGRVDTETITKKVDGKDVTTKTPKVICPDNALVITFLTEFAQAFIAGKDSVGKDKSEEEEQCAGYTSACAFLKDHSFPIPVSPETAAKVDEFIDDLPNKGKGVAGNVSGWINQQAEVNRTREAAMPKWRQWFRKIIS